MPFWTAAFFFLAEPTPLLAVLCTVSEYGFIFGSTFPVFAQISRLLRRGVSRLLTAETTTVSDPEATSTATAVAAAACKESGFIDFGRERKRHKVDATDAAAAAAAIQPCRGRPVEAG